LLLKRIQPASLLVDYLLLRVDQTQQVLDGLRGLGRGCGAEQAQAYEDRCVRSDGRLADAASRKKMAAVDRGIPCDVTKIAS
jgi:hypothetical protein